MGKIWNYLKKVVSNITVEPVVFLTCMGVGLYMIVSSELYIQKVCKVNLGFNDTICDNIQHHKEEQVIISKVQGGT